jgi:hypothetical protein
VECEISESLKVFCVCEWILASCTARSLLYIQQMTEVQACSAMVTGAPSRHVGTAFCSNVLQYEHPAILCTAT